MSVRRRIVREKAMQALYALEISHEPIELIIETIVSDLRQHKESFEFAKTLIYKVIETSKEIDAIIKGKVKNWEFNRLAVIDKIVLRIGICELLYFEDIPPKVSINEAIEIARTFSTEKSDKFVNGVLDSVLNDLRTSSRLKKSGRGLQETSLSKKPAT
ncbi:MAG: transcription antitermination factor NusB [Ignavibacteriales bacterium]|nr:transcription antitermination factor NusB [Ignavibacteriales bacterium]